ncbi:MAG: inorganic phosphate transporter, partial [Bacteroidales bacterium]
MEWYYLFLVIILLLLAIYDLSVGVANDAVNFLNSAYGSRVVKLKTLLIIASVALIIGAVFGSGMMDVARKGIFNPQMFTFHQVMIIFVVMMFSDIILLDYFNTYGLPTSTTVSMVFNLLGASFGVAIGFFIQNSIRFNEIGNYINVSSTLTIIIG